MELQAEIYCKQHSSIPLPPIQYLMHPYFN
jgi:hypothetical protein